MSEPQFLFSHSEIDILFGVNFQGDALYGGRAIVYALLAATDPVRTYLLSSDSILIQSDRRSSEASEF